MRVKDSERVTSVVQRLKVGDKFTDVDGDWEVTRESEVANSDCVTVYVRKYPDGKHTRGYTYDHGHRVTLLRT